MGGSAHGRLPEKVATAAVEFIYGSLSQSPRRVGNQLKLSLEGLYSARRGDYRVIYRIDGDVRIVTIMAIEHRSDVYRPPALTFARRQTTAAASTPQLRSGPARQGSLLSVG